MPPAVVRDVARPHGVPDPDALMVPAERGGLVALYRAAIDRFSASPGLRRSFAGWTGLGLVFTAGLSIGTALLYQATVGSAVVAAFAALVWWLVVSLVMLGGAPLLRVPPDGRLIDRYGVPNGLTAVRAYACLPLMLMATLSLPGRTGLLLWSTLGFATGMLDVLDGAIARRIGPLTELGAALDPASDALFFATGAIGSVPLGILPRWAAALLLIRYLGPLLLTPIVFLMRRRPELRYTKWGRLNTALSGFVMFVCMWVRVFNGPVDLVALLLGVPLLVTTTALHFGALVERVRHAPVAGAPRHG